jgi:hypothetical protein
MSDIALPVLDYADILGQTVELLALVACIVAAWRAVAAMLRAETSAHYRRVWLEERLAQQLCLPSCSICATPAAECLLPVVDEAETLTRAPICGGCASAVFYIEAAA